MKNRLLTPLVIASLVAGATLASAQESKPVGLSFRVGMFWPSSNSAKGAGANWLSFGVEYKIGDIKFGSQQPGYSSSYSVSIDYYSKGDFRNTPLLINYIGRKDQFYYLAGAGVGFTRVRENQFELATHTELAYQLGIGYEFSTGTTPLFAELKYIGSSDSRLAGFGAFVGVRF